VLSQSHLVPSAKTGVKSTNNGDATKTQDCSLDKLVKAGILVVGSRLSFTFAGATAVAIVVCLQANNVCLRWDHTCHRDNHPCAEYFGSLRAFARRVVEEQKVVAWGPKLEQALVAKRRHASWKDIYRLADTKSVYLRWKQYLANQKVV